MTTALAFDLLTRYYAAFNAERDDELLSLLAEGVVHDVNQGDREVGKPAFRVFLRRMRLCYQEQITQLSFSVSVDGSRASAEYVVLGKYLQADAGLPAARGQVYELPGGAFFALAGGSITRVTNYYNLQSWLAQVNAG